MIKATLFRTYLSPIKSWQRTAKTFSAPNEKSSDYSLGKFFTYEEASYSTLEEYAFDLQSRGECIGIYGTPTDLAEMDMITEGQTVRQTTRFRYPESPTLHILDLDGWPIAEAVRESVGVELTDPESMGRLIDQMLRNEGFDILADASKVVILTSSQWSLTKLNCHLYFHFSAPVTVEAMREWSTALAQVNQRTVFDPAVYKAVQPDFITPPVCANFVDPLDGKRIWYQKGANERVSRDDFIIRVEKDLKNAKWDPAGTSSKLPTIGTTWLHTIRDHCGDARGVNEPSFRAAAQLVQEMGRNNVLANINVYAKQMHDEVWKALVISGADRGQSAKDKQTYDVPRFRQYLESATKKTFGDDVDIMVSQVHEAIDKAKDGDIMALTSAPVIYSLCSLRAKHKAQFIALKTAVKQSKTISLGDLNELMRGGGGALDDSAPGDGSDVIFSMEDGARAENELIDTVLGLYDMVSDPYGNKYAAVPGNGDGGYRMMRVDGELVNVFYCDGLEMSGDQVGPNFGKKAVSKLLGKEAKAIDSLFEETLIGTRIVSEDQTAGTPTWINLGRQTNGKFMSIKLSSEGPRLMTHQDSDVRWMHGVPSLYIATNEQIEERFGRDADLTDYLHDELGKFICTDDGELTKIIMWLCSVFSDKTLSYIIELTGPAAAGKSTAADFLKDLTDPSNAPLGSGGDRTILSQHNESNFIADIEKRHVTILDNVSKLAPKVQDMLCSVATGLRHGERILYTQSQMERMVRRPLILTSIGKVITRDDLMSRVVSVGIDEADFNRNFLHDWAVEKPFLVAALLQLTSKAMALTKTVEVKPKGVGTRDIFLACVSSAMDGLKEVDFTYVLEDRMDDAIGVSEDVSFVQLIGRWMDDIGTDSDEVNFPTRGMVARLRKWVLDNAGEEINGVRIGYDMVPKTGRGLGWRLARYCDTISKVSDWEFSHREGRTNGKRFFWRRKKSVDTVEDLY